MADKTIAQQLAKLVEGIDIAMFTTVGPGGYLVSRPLSTQAASFDGEKLWFFVDATSPKVDEIRRNRRVNVAYASTDRNTYVSLAGDARLTRDKALIASFWNDALKAFFPRGCDDPDLGLIEVRPRTAEYWDGPGSFLGKALTFMVARVTGNDDAMGENRIVDLRTGRARVPPSSDSKSPREKRATVRKVAKALTAPARKPTAKKSAAKKSAAKKSATKKSAKNRTAARKPATRKSTTNKPVTRKAATKKSARRR